MSQLENDIVERLTQASSDRCGCKYCRLCIEAAKEITQLRADKRLLQEEVKAWREAYDFRANDPDQNYRGMNIPDFVAAVEAIYKKCHTARRAVDTSPTAMKEEL